MKALELELKNIGPFASSKLDFTRLEPMFLVTGKTGSGKTTIFDAMTYALYGNCTGSRKNNSSGIKSDFSNSEDEAYVIFTFLLNDSTYRVYRSVQYEYINRNGKKSTKACEVSLEIKKEDGWHKYEANKSETDKKIISLIGLSEEEFSKIVVLPQGEFAKFLHENSNTKSQTLAKLFPVDLYTKTMNSLKEKANTAKEEISFKEKQLAENLSNFETQKTTETIKKTEEKLKTFIENKEKFKNEKDILTKEITELNLKKANAEKALEIESQLKSLKSQKDKIEDLDKKIKKGRLAQKVNFSYEKFIESQKNLFQTKKSIDEEKENFSKTNELFIKLKEEKEINKLKIEFMENIKVSQQKISEYAKKVKEHNIALSNIENSKIAFKKEYGHLLAIENRYNIKKEELENSINQKKENIKIIEKLIEDFKENKKNQEDKQKAYSLAKLLQNGKPCPVCGSSQHPLPANAVILSEDIDKNIMTQEECLKKANEELSNFQNNFNRLLSYEENILEIKNKALSVSKNLCINTEQIKELNFEQNADSSFLSKLSDTFTQIDLTFSENTKKINNFNEEKFEEIECQDEELKKRLPKLNKNITEENLKSYSIQLENLYDTLKKENENFNTLFSKTENSISSSQTALEILKNQKDKFTLENKKDKELSENALKESIFNNFDEVKTCLISDKEISQGENKIETYKSEVSNLEGQLKGSKEKSENILIYKNSILEKEQNKKIIENKLSLCEKEIKELELDLQEKKTGLENGKLYKKELEKLRSKNNALITLAGEINGDNTKKTKLDAWVLSTFLERIVKAANLRFCEISSNRYRFVLNDESKGNAKAGLDLNVIDSNTGKERSSASLSGGETFMASLSLALALTDVVQQNSGGIRLDSLFIDEGFGTLDQESLDKALDILGNIQEQRMVGIISHVEGLKQAIPCHVIVEKQNTGSTIKIPY